MNEPKRTYTRTIKCSFTDKERMGLGMDLSNAIGRQRNVESEFDDVKASYKAKLSAVEAEIDRLSTAITAGFEMRSVKLQVVFRPKDRKKDFYPLDSDKTGEPVLTEEMTEEDYALELIEAEEVYLDKINTEVFPKDGSNGVEFISGRLGSKWFCVIRGAMRKGQKIEERLDSEQPSFKGRLAAVAAASKRYKEWLSKFTKNDDFGAIIDTHDKAIEGLRELVLKQDAGK